MKLKTQKNNQLWIQLGGQFRRRFRDQLCNRLWHQLDNQLWGQLVHQLSDQLWDQFKDKLLSTKFYKNKKRSYNASI